MKFARLLLVMALAVAGSPLAAQHAKRDSTLAGTLKSQSDTIFRDKSRPAYVERARLRILAVSDSLKHSKPDTVTRVDTVHKVDTVYVTKPDTQPTPPKPVATVDIHSNGSSVKVGAALQLYAEPKSSDGTTLTTPVKWSVSSTEIALISGSGVLVGRKAGTVTAIATAQTPDSIRGNRSYAVTVDSVVVPPDTTKPPPDTTTPPQPPITAWTHPFTTFTNGALGAAFPNDSVGVAYPTAIRKIAVTPTSLQAALDSAKTGDELLLPPGSLTNMTTVKPTARTGWVTVRTAVADDGDIWKMMTLARADSLNLATIQTTGGNAAAIHFNPSAHHIRFTLIKVIQGNPASLNAIVRMQNGETQASQLPHHIVFDRVVVNGLNGDNRRCFYADAAYFAVISSQIRNCHSPGADSQGILSINGTGPFRIENNYIEAGHQYTMSGGGDPAISQLVPCDWVIRNNIMTRPLAWKGVWQTKTGIETKNQCRALYEYNLIENIWPDAQAGFAVLFKSTNQDGGCTWCQTRDITFRYNRIRNASNGINLAANPQGGIPMTRVSIYDNVIEPMDSTRGGDRIPIQFLGGLSDMIVLHNTWQAPSGLNAISVDGGANTRTVLRSTYLPHGQYGIKGSGTGDGTSTLNTYFLQSIFQDMAIVGGGSCTQYPTGTTCPSSIPAVPPLGSDGKPLGADLTKVHP